MKIDPKRYNNFIKKRLRIQTGFSLVEMLVVIGTIGFSVLLLGNIPNTINLIGEARSESLAREIAAKQIEDERSIQYANLANGTQNVVDSRLRILPAGAGTIFTEDCSSQVCGQGESVKHVVVTINWKQNGKPNALSLETLIGKGGISQ